MAISAIVILVGAASGASIAYLSLRLKERARVREAHSQCGEVHRAVSDRLVGAAISLGGVLHDPGNGGGGGVTTTSRFAGDPLATSDRGSDVRLLVDDEVVEVVGPIEVILGAEETPAWLTSHLIIGSRRGANRILRPGDAVIASGVLERCEEFAGYRSDGSAQWLLRPALGDDGGPAAVGLTSAQPPPSTAAQPRGLFTGAATAIALLLLISSGDDVGIPSQVTPRLERYQCQLRDVPTAELPTIAAAAGPALASREPSLPAELVCRGENTEVVFALNSDRLPREPGALPRAVAYDDGVKARLEF